MHNPIEIRSVNVDRYITPLREGGSLPALTEADDGYKYVVKFKGAGQGVKALIAELIGGELARSLGLKVPEIVFIGLDEYFGRAEGDEEIQDLLRASEGLNLGLYFLSGAISFDPAATTVDSALASKIVWLDAFLTNIDRTFRNTNLMTRYKDLWLIDHGAALYFHHSWHNWEKHAASSFGHIKDHVLLSQANSLDEIDELFTRRLQPEIVEDIVSLIPDEWLYWPGVNATPHELRETYYQFLTTRLKHSGNFVKEAQDARKILL